jgi:hypothetical protein
MKRRKLQQIVVPKGMSGRGMASAPAARCFAVALPVSLAVHAAVLGACWNGLSDTAPAPQEYEVRICYVGEEPPSPPERLAPPVPRQESPPVERSREERQAPVTALTAKLELPLSAEPPPSRPLPENPAPAAAPVLATASSPIAIPVAPGAVHAKPSAPVEVAAVVAAPVVARDAMPAYELGYWRDVRSSIARHIAYPRLPAGALVNTNVLLLITIDDRGRLVDVAADKTSSGTPFALAATRAVHRAAPFDRPAAGTPLTVELPVRFAR